MGHISEAMINSNCSSWDHTYMYHHDCHRVSKTTPLCFIVSYITSGIRIHHRHAMMSTRNMSCHDVQVFSVNIRATWGASRTSAVTLCLPHLVYDVAMAAKVVMKQRNGGRVSKEWRLSVGSVTFIRAKHLSRANISHLMYLRVYLHINHQWLPCLLLDMRAFYVHSNRSGGSNSLVLAAI